MKKYTCHRLYLQHRDFRFSLEKFLIIFSLSLLFIDSVKAYDVEFDSLNSSSNGKATIYVYAGNNTEVDSLSWDVFDPNFYLYDSTSSSNAFAAGNISIETDLVRNSQGESNIDSLYLFELHVDYDANSVPYTYEDSAGNVVQIPARYAINVDASGTLTWQILPSEGEELGTPVMVTYYTSFPDRPRPPWPSYYQGADSTNRYFEYGIYHWSYSIGDTIFGPYHSIGFWPGEHDEQLPPEKVVVNAKIGDSITLSYHIKTNVYTQPIHEFREGYIRGGYIKFINGISIKRIPVLLVHGWNGSNESWGNLNELLEDEGYMVEYFSYPSESLSDWDIPIYSLAELLDDRLRELNDSLKIDEVGVNLICHSMGGLIARYYISHFQFASNIRKLVTLGTPNYGALLSAIANIVRRQQGIEMQFGSEFLWDLHQEWQNYEIDTEVLCIAGTGENFGDDNDGTVLLPSAGLLNLGHPAAYVSRSHGGENGLADIRDINHPSYVAMLSFLKGTSPPSNVQNVSQHDEGILILRLFDTENNPVNIRTNLLFPRAYWVPRPNFDGPPPITNGVNLYSGIYYATNVEPDDYRITIIPEAGYGTIIESVLINPRQTTVTAATVYPANESSTMIIPEGDTQAITFANTNVDMEFSSGPGGEVSVYRIDENPPATSFSTLSYYWDIVSNMPNDSFSVTISFNYDETDLTEAGLDERQLDIVYFDSLWNPQLTIIDTALNIVSISTSHFSLFTIGEFESTGPRENISPTLPRLFSLSQNHPNPFNPSTTIEFTLPKSEIVNLKVYNILGEEIATVVNNKLQAGKHTYQFDGSNLASGIYFYRIEAGEFQDVKKMILLR